MKSILVFPAEVVLKIIGSSGVSLPITFAFRSTGYWGRCYLVLPIYCLEELASSYYYQLGTPNLPSSEVLPNILLIFYFKGSKFYN